LPKEVTHWLIAEETAKNLGDNVAGESALTYPSSRAFGAIYPDILFYWPEKEGKPSPAHYYHGLEGKDSYYLLRQAALHVKDANHPGPWLAFLVGLASHVAADMVFHPLVYYLTGNYEDRDQKNRCRAIVAHRQLECLMDIFFAGRKKLRHMKLKEVVAHLELPFYDLARLDPAVSSIFPQALKNFIRLQNLFAHPLLTRGLALFNPLLPESWQMISALFYHRALDRRLSRLNSPLSYLHPVTGEGELVTMKELFHRAVEKGKKMAKEAAFDLSQGRPVFLERGASLSFGMDGEPRYFSPEPFFSI